MWKKLLFAKYICVVAAEWREELEELEYSVLMELPTGLSLSNITSSMTHK
jgi:hypothetical protein